MNKVFAVAQVVVKELYRRKDFYVLFVMTVLITLVMALGHFFTDDKILRYLKEICLLLIWISALVMAVGTAARQIPAERENRTLFPLLAKPVTRAQVVMGKFLGCWLACGVALLVFYFFFGVVSDSLGHEWRVLNFFQALWLQWIFLAVVIAMVLLGSVIFDAPSSNATVCVLVVLGILVLGGHWSKVAVQESEPMRSINFVFYFLMPHLDFFDVRDLVVHNIGLVNWGQCAAVTLYGVTYTACLLIAAWLCFRRKALN